MATPGRYPLAIVGAGALGLHFAAGLAAAGPVALVARNGLRADALRAGVQVGSRWFVPEVFAPGALLEAAWVIVLVKTGDTAEAARTALALRPRGVLSLQNGLVEPILRAACAPVAVGQGITTEGA
ncbi:MAG TPA: 2-dehydropantoate 2-reductase, partial [Zoogloea sp.]|nr:2-dehydropantoate 2-reductase [Zoogloea sp.]